MNVLGKRIKQLREKEGLNQIELAKLLNIGNTTLSQYETGQRIPSDDVKIKISKLFKVSLDYLLGVSDVQNSKDDISVALESDEELATFWNILKERDDLKLLFKQTKDLDKRSIEQVIRIIKAIEDEEDRENG